MHNRKLTLQIGNFGRIKTFYTIHRHMKKHKLFFYLIIALFIVSCSTEDDGENIIIENPGLLKVIETNEQKTEIFYSENDFIQKMEFTSVRRKHTFALDYENDKAVRLTTTINFFNPNDEQTAVYTIEYDNSQITITPVENSINANTVIIKTTDGFIDSGKIFYNNNDELIKEEIFTRNSNNNIESISLIIRDKDPANEYVNKSTFSDFDNNVKLNPIHNPVFELELGALCAVLNLKISDKNPTSSSKLTGIGYFYEEYRSIAFDYNENGFVRKGVLQFLSDAHTYNFNYYEQ